MYRKCISKVCGVAKKGRAGSRVKQSRSVTNSYHTVELMLKYLLFDVVDPTRQNHSATISVLVEAGVTLS